MVSTHSTHNGQTMPKYACLFFCTMKKGVNAPSWMVMPIPSPTSGKSEHPQPSYPVHVTSLPNQSTNTAHGWEHGVSCGFSEKWHGSSRVGLSRRQWRRIRVLRRPVWEMAMRMQRMVWGGLILGRWLLRRKGSTSRRMRWALRGRLVFSQRVFLW